MIPSPENYDSIIRDAIILKLKDNFYSANDYNWHPKGNMDNQINWISAKKMKWREANHWMGKQNRYTHEELLLSQNTKNRESRFNGFFFLIFL